MTIKKTVLALAIGVAILLGSVASPSSQSLQGKEDGNGPVVADVLSESEILEALGVPNTSRDTFVVPSADTTESSICTCDEAGKQGGQVKRVKEQDLIEENLIIEKKSGKSFNVITITIPNGDRKQKDPVKAQVKETIQPEMVARVESAEEENKEDDGDVYAKQNEESPNIKEEEEPEFESDFNVAKKKDKIKEDKKLTKFNEKKRTKRTPNKSGKRNGKKGKSKGKGEGKSKRR